LFRRLPAELVRADRQLLGDLAAAEHLDRFVRALHEPVFPQQLRRDHGASVEPRLDRVEVHDLVLDPERIVEAALGHAPVQRHLAALEPTLVMKARSRLRALVPAPGRLAVARALAAADAFLGMLHPTWWSEIIQRHIVPSFLTFIPSPRPSASPYGSCRACRACP